MPGMVRTKCRWLFLGEKSVLAWEAAAAES